MPNSLSSSLPAPAGNKATASKPKPSQQARKKRVARRRGRGPTAIESDDEIEREVASGSDSEDDEHDRSSLDSATDDSDTEPASETSPSHLESPPATTVVEVVGERNGGVAPLFAASMNWSEMVTEEASHGPSGLPVIDFADFDGQAKVPARRPKKQRQKKQQKAPPPATVSVLEPPAVDPQMHADITEETKPATTGMRSDSMPRRLGQTARQAYQQRLETDPSYVPKVGGFWGHDDRLMDKDLRSLSGWWRGKWSGRARGRGFGMRGGAHGAHEVHEYNAEDLSPVERPWTHDGFEEMKRKEDHRRQDGQAGRGRGGQRGGRGGFAGRGRGAFVPASDGMPPTPQQTQPEVEVPCSKQSEAELFDDYKARGGKPSIRVKLPGKKSRIANVKGSLDAKKPMPASETGTSASAANELQYTIRLPRPKGKQPEAPRHVLVEAPVAATSLLGPTPIESTPVPLSELNPAAQETPNPTAFPTPSVISQLEQLSLDVTPSDPERQAKTEQAVLRKTGSVASADSRPEADSAHESAEQRPVLPPIQTVFTPPPPTVNHQSPTFSSPYHFPQALPPGIAVNQHGIPYEVATGRLVYLQAPPPVYNPQPLHFAPPGLYMHGPVHPIASPDYLAQPPSHTPPVNGFVDPATGQPIFALPRSVRIEIRAPGEGRNPSSPPQNNTKPQNVMRTSSKLRTAAAAFEPSRLNGEFTHLNRTPSEGSSSNPPSYETMNGYESSQHAQQYPPMGSMVPYPAYQPNPYFYPEPYGYPQYTDMSHGHYDMYNMEQQPQGTVFY